MHSPLPWHVDGSFGSIEDAEGNTIFFIVGQWFEQVAPAPANADLLVRACNSHADLLEALESCIACLTLDSDMEEDFAEEIERSREAIRKAKSNG